MKTFYSICILLCVIISTEADAQTSQELNLALKTHQEGRFHESAIQAEYAFMLYAEPEALLLKASNLTRTGNFQEAIRSLDRIPLRRTSASLKEETHYQLALNHFLSTDFAVAHFWIEQYKSQITSDSLPKRFLLLKVLTLNELKRYEEAKIFATDYLTAIDLPDDTLKAMLQELDSIYCQTNRPKIKDITVARRLSSIIPGSGQIYAGATNEGMLSFLFNAASLGSGIFMVLNGYYITGYAVGAMLLHKFYSGGVRRAGIIAERAGDRERQLYNDQLRKWLTQHSPK